MGRVIKNNIWIFLTGILITFVIVFSLINIFLVKAQEQIKVFPASFSGDWQNPNAVFSQDLADNATFEEFNQENSAYPFIPTTETIAPEATTAEATTTETIIPPEIITSEATTSEATTTEEITPEATTTEAATTETILPEATSTEIIATTTEATTTQELATSTENTTSTEAKKPSFFAKLWEKLKGLSFTFIDKVQDIFNEEVKAEEEQSQSVFILSDFQIPKASFSEVELKNIQLRLSLAGKGEVGEKLSIDYYYQNSWQSLAEFNLENEISNNLNGGYFLFALPVFEKWSDLENLEIKFTYSSPKSYILNSKFSEIYLDSAWLEIEYEEIAEIKPQKIARRDFRFDETPEFNLEDFTPKRKGFLAKVQSFFQKEEIKTLLIQPDGREVSEGILIQGNKIKISQLDKRSFRPGLYQLKIIAKKGGEEFTQTQEFTWGVLAINVNKSIYLPSETAYLQMAALRNDGHTICDANLKLEITPPYGSAISLNVERSEKCSSNNVTDVPDYFANFQIAERGTYKMVLTNLDNGYEISDSFEVRDSVPFDVERIGPTRIYPPAAYEMVLKIKANQDFAGEVVETVPASFEIIPTDIVRQEDTGIEKLIIWDVNWKVGETYELKYQFDAPDISPYLYLLGPLEIYE